MRVYKKAVFYLGIALIFSIFISPFSLADINVDLKTDNLYLSPGSYLLQIEGEEGEDYGVTSIGPYRSWVLFENDYVSTKNGKGEVNFSIYLPEKAKAGSYKFPILVYKMSNSSVYSIENYKLIIEEKTEAKIMDLEINKDSFSPGDKIKINTTLKNTGTSDLEELNLLIEYQGPDFYEKEEKTFSLYVEEEKSFDEDFETSINQNPGEYKILTTMSKFGKKLDSKTRIFEIQEIGKIKKTHESSWRVLQESGEFRLENTGNIEKEEEIQMEITKPWDWFIFFSEMPVIKDEGTKMSYSWKMSLKPGESKNISYNIHYWPFVIIAIVLIYGIYLASKQIRKPNIKKHSIETKVLDDDRKEIMVAIEIKTCGKKMKDVVIKDRIPPMGNVIKKYFKTIKPTVSKQDNGTILRWKIKNLEKNENIILTYKFRTSIGTTDYIKLPKAVLSAKINKVYTEYFSNSLKIKE